MKTQATNTIKLGAFVISGLIILTIGIYSIGNRQNLFSRNFTLNTQFKQVSGLQQGNNVRFSGINVGTVSDIIILDDSTIQVVMLIKEEVRQFIKKDAMATIGSDGLMGNMLININPGDSQMKPVKDEGYIRSFEKVMTDEIINTLSSSNENLALLIEELLEMSKGVNRGKGTVGVLMKDSLLARDIKASVQNLKLVTQQALEVSRQLQVMVKEWQDGEGLVNTLLMDTSYSNRLDRVFLDIENATSVLNATSHQLKDLMESSEEQNVLHTVLRDSIFNANLQQSMEEIKQGTEKFNENMEALQHHWLLKKYFKNKEKEKK